MRPCVQDSLYVYLDLSIILFSLSVISTQVSVVSSCVNEGCFTIVVGVDVVHGPCCYRWSEGSSSIMLTWVGCVSCGVIVVVVLLSIFACGDFFGPVWLSLRWLWIGYRCCSFVIVVFLC